VDEIEFAPHLAAVDTTERPARLVDGWTFIRGANETEPAIWGEGDAILWAQGEPLMLYGPDGVGKTSVVQQLTLRRLTGEPLLGLPVAPLDGKILYLAADRPKQAARSMRRMVDNDLEDILRDNLIVHRGPLPFELTREPPWTLRNFVEELGAADVIVDSLKDIAPRLTEDETGSTVNNAFQELVAAGHELAVLHHPRKQQQGAPPPKSLADVYGSRWLVAGMGSIALLWGEPGDLVVQFRHMKQPLEEVGPFNVLHDHVHGITTVHGHVSLDELLTAAGPTGLTVKYVAETMFGNDSVNTVEKARRRLDALVAKGHAERCDIPDEGIARYRYREAA
jgi:replicative DNA helicase